MSLLQPPDWTSLHANDRNAFRLNKKKCEKQTGHIPIHQYYKPDRLIKK